MTPEQDRWSDPNKYDARREFIVDGFRQFVADQLPKDQHYYSLCGVQGGELSEMRCVVDSGMITEEQFVGIDGGEDGEANIRYNKSLFPKTRWLYGDWLDTMEALSHEKTWSPGIVHLDTINLADANGGINLAACTLNLLSSCCATGVTRHPVYVVVNLMATNPYSGHRTHHDDFPNGIRDMLENEELYVHEDGGDLWQCLSYTMEKCRTEMVSYRFLIRP